MQIKIDNLFYTYMKNTPSEYLALKDISLSVDKGDFIAFIGHTGSGKSTLIQHLNALLRGDKGNITIDEYDIPSGKKRIKNIKKLRKKVGVVFQFPEYQLFEDTVEKDVAYGPINFGMKKEDAIERAHQVLSYVDIKEEYYKRSPFELSGGEKRRVAIAGILAFSPDILVLDEPTAGLDPEGQKTILSLLKKMNEDGHTIIIVTHDMEIVKNYTNKVFVLSDGELVFKGTPKELFKQDVSDYHIEIPKIYQLVNLLNEKGMDIPLDMINDVKDLKEYLGRKK